MPESIINVSSLVAAIKHYFEFTASDLMREFQALTESDKRDYAQMLRARGYAWPFNEAKGY